MLTSKHMALLAGTLITVAAMGTALHGQDEPPSRAELIEQSRPGPEHERLAALEGNWEVVERPAVPGAEESLGTAQGSAILDGRFLVLDFTLDSVSGARSFRYTLGYDRRHDEYSIVVMDTSGTYFVTARGAEVDGLIHMSGVDDDPMMARMGFEKKFVFGIDFEDKNTFSVTLFFVDTRTAEEKLMPYTTFTFMRKS
jgi:hypothetical protein